MKINNKIVILKIRRISSLLPGVNIMSSNVSNTSNSNNQITPQNFTYVQPLDDPNRYYSDPKQIELALQAGALAGINGDSGPNSGSSSSSTATTTSSGVQSTYVLNQQSYDPVSHSNSSGSSTSTTTVTNADGTTTTTTTTTTGTDTSQTSTTSGTSISSFARAQNSATGFI